MSGAPQKNALAGLIAGWMNYRVATTLHLEETATTYRITTIIQNIIPATLNVLFDGEYLIIEGSIRSKHLPSPYLGRYVKPIGKLENADFRYVDTTYSEDGTLFISIRKHP